MRYILFTEFVNKIFKLRELNTWRCKMIIEKELLSLKDAAEVCGVKTNTLANWRDRDSKFPLPYMEVGSGPVWKAEDIVAYMNRKYKKLMYDMIAINNLSSKKIALMGRARVGKSFIISRFVEDRKSYVRLFCGNSKDKTACPINVRISEQVAVENYIFHSNFNSLYSGEKKADDELQQFNIRLSELLHKPHTMSENDVMKEIEEAVKKIRDFEKKYDSIQPSDTYIDVYQKPSEYAKKLLRECKLGSIEFTDTPGVSGKVAVSKIAKSDIYVFVLRPDNEDEAKTLLKVVEAIKADVATSKVLYVYKIEGIYSSKEEYNEAREEVKNNISAFTSIFDDLRGSIISTDLALLNPEEHCIAFPSMNKEKPSFQEDEFMSDFMGAMVDAFKESDTVEQDKKLKEIFSEHGGEAKELVKRILMNIPAHLLGKNDEYSVDNIQAENHDRVKTRDNYRIANDLSEAYMKESELLHNYFTSFKVNEYPLEWQQYIIKYIYNKLTSSTRTDRGLGKGGHPFEERPARTMLVEESLLADRVLSSINGLESFSRNTPYRKVFIDNNIFSATWNYVGCSDDKEAELKLRLIKECLMDKKVSSRKELVLCRYVGGLRLVAEYEILELLGESDTNIIAMLQKSF